MKPIEFVFKVDVDTYKGFCKGGRNLLRLFQREGVEATFFVTMGPDLTGRAWFRFFRKKGFLEKMFRNRALKTYGIDVALSGLFFPCHWVGTGEKELLLEIKRCGQEVGIHGWDHTLWHDYLPRFSFLKVGEEIFKAWESYRRILGHPPYGAAAPGWMITDTALLWKDWFGFVYLSDCRGDTPFFPLVGGVRFHTLQIPTTLPTMDEALGREGIDEKNFHEYLLSQVKPGLNVHTIHAEVEGMAYLESLGKLIRELKKKKVFFSPLIKVARRLLKKVEEIPVKKVKLAEIPGRAGFVAVAENS